MIDFSLTESGDLLLASAFMQKSSIQIDFAISESNPIRVDFYLQGFLPSQNEKGVTIAFELTDTGKKAASQIVKDRDYYKQGAIMRLQTPLGELPQRKEMGSKLESIRHHNLHEKATQVAAEEIAKEALKDFMPNAKISVSPNVSIRNGYEQAMEFKLYDEDLIINYRMR